MNKDDIRKIEALVFEGGGVKGIAHCGALRQLEYYGIDLKGIRNFAGTSAGSQMATLLACGYTTNEIRYILFNIPVLEFKNKGVLRNIKRLFCTYGIYKGDHLEKYIDDLVSKKLGKKRATFADLFTHNHKVLRITGMCLSTAQLEYFDVELTPDMPISKAVRISSSVPLLFAAVKYKNNYYVDGGGLMNLPVFAFPNIPTIFLRFKDPVPYTNKRKINNFVNFLNSLFEVSTIYSNKVGMNEHMNSFSTFIEIDTLGIDGFKFDMEDDTKFALFNQGEHAVNNVIRRRLSVSLGA